MTERSILRGMAGLTMMGIASAVGAGQAVGAEAEAGAFYRFSFTGIDGEALPADRFRGKVVLVVNTASRCGFTPQFKGLEALWDAYKDRGLVVLGVPSNDFGGQEPLNEAEIAAFCELNYGVSFPLTAKEQVVGEKAHPFFAFARETLGPTAAPQWNFHKYLVDAEGRLVDWFSTTTSPESARVRDAVEKLLPKG